MWHPAQQPADWAALFLAALSRRQLHFAAADAHRCPAAGLHLDPPEFDMNWARQEAELVMFKAVDDLLRKTGLHPRQIDVLGACCRDGGGSSGGGRRPSRVPASAIESAA